MYFIAHAHSASTFTRRSTIASHRDKRCGDRVREFVHARPALRRAIAEVRSREREGVSQNAVKSLLDCTRDATKPLRDVARGSLDDQVERRPTGAGALRSPASARRARDVRATGICSDRCLREPAASSPRRVGISDAVWASPTHARAGTQRGVAATPPQRAAAEALGAHSSRTAAEACDLPCVSAVTPDRWKTGATSSKSRSDRRSKLQRRKPWTTRRTSSSPGCTSRM